MHQLRSLFEFDPGVFGGLDLHGLGHNAYWTRLSETAEEGEDKIKLEDSVDWQGGDQIVIATTSYNPSDTEVVTIKDDDDDDSDSDSDSEDDDDDGVNNELELGTNLHHTHVGQFIHLIF